MGTNGVSPMVCGHHYMSYRVVQVTARTGHGTAPHRSHQCTGTYVCCLSPLVRPVPLNRTGGESSTRCKRPPGENPLGTCMGMWDVYADVDIFFLIVTSYSASWVNV